MRDAGHDRRARRFESWAVQIKTRIQAKEKP